MIAQLFSKIGCKNFKSARAITRTTYDIRSSELLENLSWKFLDVRGNNLKLSSSIKFWMATPLPIITKHFDLKHFDTYNLRNRNTDLALQMPKEEFSKRCFSYSDVLH